jgi:FkbM family methyltransferase
MDVELFRSLLPPGALCFDVGANIGEKSEALLDAGARVVAFEPNPQVLPELRARCRHRSNWSVVATALGSGPAIATLRAQESHGQSSLSESWEGKVIATYKVPVVTLDSAIQCFGAPFFCKIDVEGWELEVLMGLTQPIPLLSFEFHLNERDIAKTGGCLRKLAQFGPSRINITPAESSSFHFDDWIPLAQFLAWFPGDLDRTLPGYRYGDIFVRNDAA